MQPAIFIDRDDTLIHNIPYLSDPSKVVLTPGAGTTLAALAQAGFQIFLITNQSGIGRGYFTVHELNAVHDRLKELLRAFEEDLNPGNKHNLGDDKGKGLFGGKKKK